MPLNLLILLPLATFYAVLPIFAEVAANQKVLRFPSSAINNNSNIAAIDSAIYIACRAAKAGGEAYKRDAMPVNEDLPRETDRAALPGLPCQNHQVGYDAHHGFPQVVRSLLEGAVMLPDCEAQIASVETSDRDKHIHPNSARLLADAVRTAATPRAFVVDRGVPSQSAAVKCCRETVTTVDVDFAPLSRVPGYRTGDPALSDRLWWSGAGSKVSGVMKF